MALCIASSPFYSIIIVAWPKKQFFYSPLKVFTDRLQKNTQSSLSNLEQIISYAAPPWWTPPLIIIKPSEKEAQLAYKNLIKTFLLGENLFVYTNESVINKKVGTSATTRAITWNSFLGFTNLFMVYLGEL